MAGPWKVDVEARLMVFLRSQLTEWKRSTLEQRVQSGHVWVNGSVCTKNVLLAVGDEVAVTDRPGPIEAPPPRDGLDVLFEDEMLVAIDKPAGLLSVPAGTERERTALALLRAHLAAKDPGVRLWPVHRLDRETSGVLLFARFEDVCNSMQQRWEQTDKRYLAWVEGHVEPSEGVIDTPLWEDRHLFVHVGKGKDAKPARTRYRTLESTRHASKLEVALETGRKHQIRAHLASIGHPVIGDARYGTKGRGMLLHAWRLGVTHPSGHRLHLEAPVPRRFRP